MIDTNITIQRHFKTLPQDNKTGYKAFEAGTKIAELESAPTRLGARMLAVEDNARGRTPGRGPARGRGQAAARARRGQRS